MEDLGKEVDFGEEIRYERCEMCGNEKIRYVHIMTHPEYQGELRVQKERRRRYNILNLLKNIEYSLELRQSLILRYCEGMIRIVIRKMYWNYWRNIFASEKIRNLKR